MKKIYVTALLALWVPLQAFAQSVQEQYLSQSFRETFDLEGLQAMLSSPQFQIALLIALGALAGVLSFYLWGSLKMAYGNLEMDVFRKIGEVLGSSKPSTPKMDLPHLQSFNAGRMGFAPNLVAVDHQNEEKSEPEEEPTRGEPKQTRG